jgi:hypothetical protein
MEGTDMSLKSAIALDSASQKARRDTRELEQEIRVLEQRVGRLSLASIAMAELLRDRLGIPGEVIEAKIREIDLRDGKEDRMYHPSAKTCQACDRISGPMSATCFYCGTPFPKESFPIG